MRVITPNASVTDIGTQFEVAVEGEALRIAVREGEVEVSTSGSLLHAGVRDGMGEALLLDGMALRDRQPISPVDPHWSWTQSARPGFKISGRSVYDYLDWAARETGCRLVFESDLVRQQAQLQRFGGQGEADTDIAQVLRTTRFQFVQNAADELVVGFHSL